jgi:hypothetical protein
VARGLAKPELVVVDGGMHLGGLKVPNTDPTLPLNLPDRPRKKQPSIAKWSGNAKGTR